jgi:CubicO group peptidase (beta-lactamase class C family)
MALESVRATAEERRRRFPGDDLTDEVLATWTHGVSIHAPPRAVWPWLAQMGAGRAGWYSWDRLDNGGRPSAEEIDPALARVAVGDVMPAGPGVRDAFVVGRVEPGRELVLGLRDDDGGWRGTWDFLLDPVAEARTRLLVRVRVSGRGWMKPLEKGGPAAAHGPGLVAKLPRGPVLAVLRAIHRVMQARQLRGIRRRAQAHAVPAVGGPRTQAAPKRSRGRLRVEGHVAPGFEKVREVFAENFTKRRELGGACCAYLRGEKVVDLWGGVRDKVTGARWEGDTMALVYSATKGLAAMTLAVAHSRGWLDYEERVCTYWPEFAANGKEAITVRQLLGHQAGLIAFDETVDRSVVADLERLAAVMARQRPAWEPGTRQGYHVISLGFYEGELLRRVDPKHRSLGQFFREELAKPLGLEFYVRLPESMPDARLAPLAFANPFAMMLGVPLHFTLALFNHRSFLYRAGAVNPGTELPRDAARIYARELEVPSGGGVGTARAIARAYGVFAAGGAELGLRPETLRALEAPAARPTLGYEDAVLGGELRYSLGFMKPSPVWPFGPQSAYGAPGTGGALGFADPEAGLGYGYVTSQMGTSLTGDPREVALRRAIYAAVGRRGR